MGKIKKEDKSGVSNEGKSYVGGASITVAKFIETELIGAIDDIKERHPYLAFVLIASGIEFLGKCLCPNADWHESDPKGNFEKAINTLDNFQKYRSYTGGNGNHVPDVSLYGELRCGLVHAFLPQKDIILHSGSGECKIYDDKKVHLYIETFFDDFKNACKELDVKTDITKKDLSGGFILIETSQDGSVSSGMTSCR